MKLDDKQIGAIVERVVERLGRELGGASQGGGQASAPAASHRAARYSGGRGIYETVDEATRAATRAFEELQEVSLETRYAIVAAMRAVCHEHNDAMARMTVEETKLGRVACKLKKNALAIDKTPGPEILKPQAFSGDNGLSIMERAPYGVIGSISPCTNPTETIINNGIGFVAGGNAAVFNVHPSARNVSNYLVDLLNQAIEGAGGPANVICSVTEPTIESAGQLMKHRGIRLLVVTGGGAVVKAAMGSGKRAIAAGPGNPPVIVDETVDLAYAAEKVIEGASYDNNIICIDEKVLICIADVADALKREMKKRNVIEVSGNDLKRLEKVIFTPDDHINRDFVGKNANVILDAIGIRAGDEVRLVLADVDEKHPLVQHEQLMPVLPLVRATSADEAIAMAKRVEHGYGHTAVMYSRDITRLHKMARTINTSIFVKNAPAVAGIGAGGEGYTSFTIASPTGEGLTTALSFTRERRCTLKEYFRFV